MKKRDKKILFFIVLRYIIILAIVICLPWIYRIFSPLTIYPVIFLLKSVYNSAVLFDKIYIVINMKTFIQIIPACIAGSAYLLLLILNLSVPMNLKKRVSSLALSVLLLLILNILRIFLLSILYYQGSNFFNFTHVLFWYVLSTLFVVAIWFLIVKIFVIKNIPFYSDLNLLYKDAKKI